MRTKVLFMLVGALCLLLALVPACSKAAPHSGGPEEIRIGAVCSLSGMFAGFGQGSGC